MCHASIIQAVGQHVKTSRRNFLKTSSSAMAASVPMALVASDGVANTLASTLTKTSGRIIDLTHTITPDFPSYYGRAHFAMRETRNQTIDGYTSFALDIPEHFGTHIDAPIHFADDVLAVDALPPSHLIVPLVVINIAARAEGDADTRLTPDDIRHWQNRYGDIPQGACVAMHSGWAKKVHTPAFRGFDGTLRHFPGFHVETAYMLLEETQTTSLAVDTFSLDHGISPDFPTHRVWLPVNRFGIENIANLDQVPEAGATLFIGAPKHQGGSGGQARIMAVV